MRWGFSIAAAFALLPLGARAQDTAEPYPCFDVAVVAHLVRQTPGPFPADPDVIVVRWPWILDFETEQVLIGHEERARFRVMMPLHAHFRGDIQHFLLFLRRDAAWGYRVIDSDIYVVADRRGRFVIPLEAPLKPEEVRPENWYPANYESYLRPVHYRPQDAWWIDDSDVNSDDVSPGWYERLGSRIVALRGIYLSDLSRMMAAEPGAICKPAG